MNQLWRNMLLALAVENDPESPYDGVHFSVVNHPDNHSLESTMHAFREITDQSHRFGWLSSKQIMDAVDSAVAPALQEWAAWYRELYAV